MTKRFVTCLLLLAMFIGLSPKGSDAAVVFDEAILGDFDRPTLELAFGVTVIKGQMYGSGSPLSTPSKSFDFDIFTLKLPEYSGLKRIEITTTSSLPIIRPRQASLSGQNQDGSFTSLLDRKGYVRWVGNNQNGDTYTAFPGSTQQTLELGIFGISRDEVLDWKFVLLVADADELVVPLPASGILMMGSVGAFALLRRRSKRATS